MTTEPDMPVLLKLCLIILFVPFAFAEEELDWELDWELDFEIREKSTLSDFPLQEIGGEELSNAAIAGALQKDSVYQRDGEGKPAYLQEQESSNKNKVARVQKEQLDETLDAERFLQSIPELPRPIDFQQETYQIPTGRTYEHWENHTVERE